MKNGQKKRKRSLTAVTVRLAALTLALWLIGMAALTVGVTQYVLADLTCTAENLASVWVSDSMLDENSRPEDLPGYLDYRMIELTNLGGFVYTLVPETEGVLNIFHGQWVSCQAAAMILDSDNNVLRRSGNYFCFPYSTEEQWKSGADTLAGYGWIDLDSDPDGRYEFLHCGMPQQYYAAMRITGYFDGEAFRPLAMAVIERVTVRWANARRNYELEIQEDLTVQELLSLGLLEWEEKFDRLEEAPEGVELVTVYTDRPWMKEYADNGGLLDAMRASWCGDDREAFMHPGGGHPVYSKSQVGFTNLLLINGYTVNSRFGTFTFLTGVRANPMLIAMGFLRYIYIVTFAAAAVGCWLARRAIRRKLIDPLTGINNDMAGGLKLTAMPGRSETWWAEPYELREHYRGLRDELKKGKDEITRLETALEYAKTAEEHRRQMTSNIAHELKTPLAVIHSYAEGLKERIAEDKRDRYLAIILAESERMDAMVLDMLDLSRLEAGKVKLTRDDFPLGTLTRGIFEKLEMAAQAKNLQVDFLFSEDPIITADESRIAQVIENFATNAIKYSPVGGSIAVRLESTQAETVFSVENESAPLSREALGKVWDTFYRVDESRSGSGTGLGLAIAKSIVELHGGACFARNTKTGIVFGFTL